MEINRIDIQPKDQPNFRKMNFLNKISKWFKSEDPIGESLDKIDDRDFEWCIIGNIVDQHYYGEEKEIRRGTKQFGPGAKVYCLPEFGGMGHEQIRVIGKPRKQNRLINIVMASSKIKNYRVQKVFHRKIQVDIGKHPYYWSMRRSKNEVKELNEMKDLLNTLTKEIEEKS